MQPRPLPDTNPELLIFESPGVREYRVENWHLSRLGNGDVLHGAHDLGWQDFSILAAFLYFEVIEGAWLCGESA
jgi:phosphatidylinositol glycan class H protein